VYASNPSYWVDFLDDENRAAYNYYLGTLRF
jgi:hypothetical protein